jgi:ABC-type cobalamin transport system ATPase subunit
VADILTPEHLSALYDTRFEAVDIRGRRVFYQA